LQNRILFADDLVGKALPVTFGLAFYLQLAASQKKFSESANLWFNVLNLGSLLVVPLALNWIMQPAPGSFTEFPVAWYPEFTLSQHLEFLFFLRVPSCG
jgi:hypothetical protein